VAFVDRQPILPNIDQHLRHDVSSLVPKGTTPYYTTMHVVSSTTHGWSMEVQYGGGWGRHVQRVVER
jgi:hypothetical protein